MTDQATLQRLGDVRVDAYLSGIARQGWGPAAKVYEQRAPGPTFGFWLLTAETTVWLGVGFGLARDVLKDLWADERRRREALEKPIKDVIQRYWAIGIDGRARVEHGADGGATWADRVYLEYVRQGGL